MTATADLDTFLAKYDSAVEKLARVLMARMKARLPGATRLVYDNYNGLVIGYGPNEKAGSAILSLLVVPRWVTLCFLQGAALDDPARVLRGDGHRVRNIRMMTAAAFDEPHVEPLLAQAIANAEPAIPTDGDGPMIIKSVSPRQRPRRPT